MQCKFDELRKPAEGIEVDFIYLMKVLQVHTFVGLSVLLR